MTVTVETPWSTTYEGGSIVVTRDHAVWVYLELPRHPYSFRDADDRLASAAPLHAALTEIGKWSIDGTGFGGVAETTARDRQVTLHAWRVEDPPGVPASATPRYAKFLEEQINPALSSVPRPYAMIGVRAWPDADTDETPGLLGPIRELAARVVLPGRPFDIAPYRADIERIRRTVTQLIPGARVPSSDLMDLFTWWFAPRTREATPVVVTRDMVVVDEGLSLQFHTLSSITDEGHHLNAATDAWVHYAMNYADPAVSVTVGFNLRGAATARRQARRGLRTLMRTVDEEAATEAAGGAGRPELEDRLRHVSDIEQHFATDSTAVPCDLTVIVASEAGAHPSVRPLPSELETTFGMRFRSCALEQSAALRQTLPGGLTSTLNTRRGSGEDVTAAYVSHSGVAASAEIGDDPHRPRSQGSIFIGQTVPDGNPVWFDPSAAFDLNSGPNHLIIGATGSGKTMFAQILAMSAVLLGYRVWFINPKPADDLSPLVDLVGGEVITLTKASPGAFDAWRYVDDPEAAAVMASDFVLRLLPQWAKDEAQAAALRLAMHNGALTGARCTLGALRAGGADPQLIQILDSLVTSSPLVRVVVGREDVKPFESSGKLTLLQFDVSLGSSADSSEPQRVASLIQQHLTRGANYELARRGGGIVFTDEAQRWLRDAAQVAGLQQGAAEGRSQNVVNILMVQQLSTVLDAEIGEHLTYVWALASGSGDEARRVLDLFGLEATPERVTWMQSLAAVPGEGGAPGVPARALMRGMRDRAGSHRIGAVAFGPWPAWLLKTLSTNRLDREDRAHRSEHAPEGV